MFKIGSLRIDRFVTPRRGLRHWVVVLKSRPSVIIAGPFPTRDLARKRHRAISAD